MVEHADLAGSGADVGKKQRLLFKMEVRGDDRLHCKVTETRLVRTGENLDVDSRKEFDAFQEDVRVSASRTALVAIAQYSLMRYSRILKLNFFMISQSIATDLLPMRPVRKTSAPSGTGISRSSIVS